jgi:hypothetical protein
MFKITYQLWLQLPGLLSASGISGTRTAVPGTHFPDDPEIHLEKQKKIWVKGSPSSASPGQNF